MKSDAGCRAAQVKPHKVIDAMVAPDTLPSIDVLKVEVPVNTLKAFGDGESFIHVRKQQPSLKSTR